MTFETWKDEVNRLCALHTFGFTTDDFRDYMWHDEFTSGQTPDDAFVEWLDAGGLT